MSHPHSWNLWLWHRNPTKGSSWANICFAITFFTRRLSSSSLFLKYAFSTQHNLIGSYWVAETLAVTLVFSVDQAAFLKAHHTLPYMFIVHTWSKPDGKWVLWSAKALKERMALGLTENNILFLPATVQLLRAGFRLGPFSCLHIQIEPVTREAARPRSIRVGEDEKVKWKWFEMRPSFRSQDSPSLDPALSPKEIS
jgi:hypothetical protein